MDEEKKYLILVVDDEPDVVFFLQAVLEDHGFQVMTAFDGQEAMEKINQRKPDLISLDLLMPGKSGIRFFHELRKNKIWSAIPVLFVTGHVEDVIDGSNLKELLKDRSLSGPATYLEKPVTAESYINAVRVIMGLEKNFKKQKETKIVDLREQVQSLLSNARAETLQKILHLLEEEKRENNAGS